jgi:hypothetical protein
MPSLSAVWLDSRHTLETPMSTHTPARSWPIPVPAPAPKQVPAEAYTGRHRITSETKRWHEARVIAGQYYAKRIAR